MDSKKQTGESYQYWTQRETLWSHGQAEKSGISLTIRQWLSIQCNVTGFSNLFVFFGRVVYNGFACIRYELGKDANMTSKFRNPGQAANGFDRAVDWDWEVRYVHETLGIHETGVAALEVLRLMGRNSQPSNFSGVDSRNRRKTNDKDFKHQVLISGFDPIQEKSTRHKTRSAPKVQTRFTCTFQCHPTTEVQHLQHPTGRLRRSRGMARVLLTMTCPWPTSSGETVTGPAQVKQVSCVMRCPC